MPREYKHLYNFSGTLLWKDLPIVDFTVANGEYTEWVMHPENRAYYPVEFWNQTWYGSLHQFIDVRIVPITRQGLDEVLQDIGLTEYTWDGIIKANYGLCTDDCYWFKPKGSSLKYDDIKIRD